MIPSASNRLRSQRPAAGPTPQLAISLSSSVGAVGNPVTVTGSITNPAGGDTTGTFSANLAGTWSNTSITLNSGTLSFPRTFTPSVDGVATITLTGNNGAASATPATYTANVLGSGDLAFSYYVSTTNGATGGEDIIFGKHTQWAWCPADGKVYAYGGDGTFRVEPDIANAVGTGGHNNCVFSYDFGNGGLFTQETEIFGNPADGTMPYYHDGCTWVYNSIEDKFYAIPGYLTIFFPSWDPNGIADQSVLHKWNRTTKAWEAGPTYGGNWPGEHWGGCYDSNNDVIWIQSAGGSYGSFTRFNCYDQSWTPIGGHGTNPAIPPYTGQGVSISCVHWPQAFNPATNEVICFDGYRGLVYGISIYTGFPRILGTVPALRADVGEPVGNIETGLAFSNVRQKVYLSYSTGGLVVGGLSGIYIVDIATGTTSRCPHTSPFDTFTECVYDDTNDLLVVTGIYNSDGPEPEKDTWGRRLCVYEHLP